MSFEVDIGYSSARGPRARNEDFAGAVRQGDALIAAIADGVSAGGEGVEAAQTTVMGLLADYFATPAHWEPTAALDRLIGAQNSWLFGHNRRRAGAGSALTTLTALVLHGQGFTLAHVGDTRAWRVRTGEAAELLTEDHAHEHPDLRSRLSRAIGLDGVVRVDYLQGDAQVGDVFVLTSDGVHGRLKPARIAELVLAGDAQGASDTLVQAALQAGSRDNASALVLHIRGLDARQLDDELQRAQRLALPPALAPGALLDGWQIDALVADSGVHRLYRAHAAEGAVPVAIKTLSAARAGDAEERAMLAHEAWLGERLRGIDGLVRVRPHAAQSAALYLVFDWHAGRTIDELRQGGARAGVAELVEAGIALARTLGRLHRHGVVHRDVKPGNLHRGDDGRWRVLDLGVALSGRESEAQRLLHAGTPSYINPEQWQGASADAGSDLFALGVTLYQWLTGRLPYGEIEPYQSGRYRRDPVAPSRIRADVPIWLDHLLLKAVARDARQRFETAEELLLALERGAARPLAAPLATPLLRRDPRAPWQLALLVSLLFNALLVLWLLFLPR